MNKTQQYLIIDDAKKYNKIQRMTVKDERK